MKKINYLPFFPVLFFTFSIFNLSSCSYTPEAAESLDLTLKAYERAIRWRNYNVARSLLKNPEEVTDLNRQRLKNIRVTSYMPIAQVVAPDFSKAELVVDIRYYYDNSAVERLITDRQLWLYDAAQNRWQLDTAFPDFKFH